VRHRGSRVSGHAEDGARAGSVCGTGVWARRKGVGRARSSGWVSLAAPFERAAARVVVRGMLALARRRAARDPSEGMYQTDQVRWLEFHRWRLTFRRWAGRTRETIAYEDVRNLLPNSGPLQLPYEFHSASDVVATFRDPTRRSQGVAGYEGFAPDDAVFDEVSEARELWSNANLAASITSFAYETYVNPSIIELGCGPAHLFFFFSRYGIRDYIGMDGNPLLLCFTRHVQGNERHFHILDLQQEIRLSQGKEPLTFDVLCSFEVLEHIREDRLGAFLQTIRNHMHTASTLLCTASTVDWMDVHVLVRSREWWLDRFAKAGLVPRRDSDGLCQSMLENHPFNWDTSTTNVFVLRLES